ncbi:unnamed protein product [Blepharisma stoltei]|uniref:Uncharacterized protein n=1 Tax=Blepharisma stoltei TaxID=1481888 RepID=A0AAU9JMA6_9CILI|nr:unnamed protein product [Blepharisma stoltei]
MDFTLREEVGSEMEKKHPASSQSMPKSIDQLRVAPQNLNILFDQKFHFFGIFVWVRRLRYRSIFQITMASRTQEKEGYDPKL